MELGIARVVDERVMRVAHVPGLRRGLPLSIRSAAIGGRYAATFRVYLPRVEEAIQPVAAEEGVARATRETQTLLLVEDEVALLQPMAPLPSGYSEPLVEHHGVLQPGGHFLQKPFMSEDLVYRVREALNG